MRTGANKLVEQAFSRWKRIRDSGGKKGTDAEVGTASRVTRL